LGTARGSIVLGPGECAKWAYSIFVRGPDRVGSQSLPQENTSHSSLSDKAFFYERDCSSTVFLSKIKTAKELPTAKNVSSTRKSLWRPTDVFRGMSVYKKRRDAGNGAISRPKENLPKERGDWEFFVGGFGVVWFWGWVWGFLVFWGVGGFLGGGGVGVLFVWGFLGVGGVRFGCGLLLLRQSFLVFFWGGFSGDLGGVGGGFGYFGAGCCWFCALALGLECGGFVSVQVWGSCWGLCLVFGGVFLGLGLFGGVGRGGAFFSFGWREIGGRAVFPHGPCV